jgi:hypothetical protein
MGLSLGSLVDPGAIVHKVVDSVLPKDMQWVGGLAGAVVDYQAGNPVGAAQQATSALSDMKDLPQGATAGKPATSSAAPAAGKPALQASSNPPWSYEPSPPVSRVTTITVTTTTTTTSSGTSGTSAGAPAVASSSATPPKPPASTTTTPLGNDLGTAPKTMSLTEVLQAYMKAHPAPPPPANTAATKSATPNGAPPNAGTTNPPPDPRLQSTTHGGWRASAAPPPPPPPKQGTTTTTITTTVTSGSSASPAPAAGWRATIDQLKNAGVKPPAHAATPASGATASAAASASAPQTSRASAVTSSANASSTTPAANASAATPAANASATTPAASTKPSNVDPSTLSKDNFMKLSDDDLMKAVRDGKIPSDVTDSNDGMLELQARMNHISEMNQMMTTMMQSMHQMKMSVIENIKA